MKRMTIFRAALKRRAASTLAWSTLIVLAACGGGDTKTGSNGTGQAPPSDEAITAAGPLNSLGPAGVGALTLTDTSALVQVNAAAPRPVGELRLGMQAEISGSIVANAANGAATVITTQSAAIGPVGSVDTGTGRLTILSLVVQIDQNTIFDGLPSLAALTPGARVEVFGLPQAATNAVLATRLAILPPSSTAPVELLGNATNLTTSQFTVQGVQVTATTAQVTIGGVPTLPPVGTSPPSPLATIANNARVRVIGTFDSASGTLTATQIVSGLNPVRNDNSVLVLDGLVQSVSAPGRFRLADTEVDASAVGGGNATAGARVQVRGRKQAGLLTATTYRLIAANERTSYVIQGDIAELTSASSFRVRGELIAATAASFSGGNASNLANGRRVRVVAFAGAGRLEATDVTFLP